ncbi:MAG: hypothetical protein ACRDAU_02735 [Clostridium sp.]
MFNIKIDDNHTLKKFFKKFSNHEKEIIKNIHTILPVFITEKPYKIKTAHGLKFKGDIIYEYKVVINKFTNFRAAYTLKDNDILVIFISDTTIKRDFVNLLSSLNDVSK